ncbi:MAG: hypothetical protein KCHDKBKB_01277 [Elusimicrobia bacterium]|nr:hypothetical protein [Elusimicrobiota bacterium]
MLVEVLFKYHTAFVGLLDPTTIGLPTVPAKLNLDTVKVDPAKNCSAAPVDTLKLPLTFKAEVVTNKSFAVPVA